MGKLNKYRHWDPKEAGDNHVHFHMPGDGPKSIANMQFGLCGVSTGWAQGARKPVDCPDCIAIVDACKAVEEKEMKR